MIRWTLTLIGTLAFLLSPSPLPAQSPPSAAPPGAWANKFFLKGIETDPSQEAPSHIDYDFGSVAHGTLCVKKFTITNIYGTPMQVLDVRRSCGCLDVYPPQKVLQPNEQADFIISMDTAKFKGPNTQTVFVTFGPRFVSTAELRITANSRADVMLNPGRIHFGTVPQGKKVSQTVTLDYQGKDQRKWSVVGYVPPTGPFTIDVKQISEGFATGKKFEITVGLKDDAPAGPISEVVILKTNDPTAPIVQINVTGTIQAPITANPNKVVFENVKVGTTVSSKVLVRGSLPFKLDSIPTDEDGVEVEAFPGAGPVHNITIRFTPTKAGKITKTLRLESNIDATVTIQVEATAVP